MSRLAPGPMGLALALALLSLMLLGCVSTPRHEAVSAPVEGLPVGSGAFLADVSGRQIEVFTYRATNHAPDSPVILVLAGGGRNGDDYRDAWIASAERYGLLVLAPAFDETQFPGPIPYNLAGMIEADADAATLRSVTLTSPERWLFRDIEAVFDQAVARTGSQRSTYDIFGHSAGAQIIHRMVLFSPDMRARVAVAANAGWYTMPTADAGFPYGLGGLPPAVLRHDAFQRPLVLLLGELDNADETRGELRSTPETDSQGAHRLARGRRFHQLGQVQAERSGVPFDWRLTIVPGVGHDYRRMSEAAAAYLYGEARFPVHVGMSGRTAPLIPPPGG